MEISNRLKALARMVSEVDVVADIGCDHGYVPITLLKDRRIKKAIAMDINKGPLERAKKNIEDYGYSNQIETRLSNGFDALHIGEVDLAIIAGMGGKLMISILSKEIDKTKSIPHLILQPQSDIEEVRRFLPTIGYVCVEEDMLEEDHKFYFLMKLQRTEEEIQPFSEMELRFGKFLLQNKNVVLKQYLERKKEEYQKIADSILSKKIETNARKNRIEEINKELFYVNQAIAYYDVDYVSRREELQLNG